jgi:hypothetical protein
VRRLALLTATLAATACREPAHIDVAISMECQTDGTIGMPPSVPSSCQDMLLGCANFLEVRLYESNAGKPGNLLRSHCVAMSDLGRPANLCDLTALHTTTLLTDLPDNKTVLLRMRALWAIDSSSGCNDDIPGEPAPVLLFDGFSDAVALDGADHKIAIHVATCGSCHDLPVACIDMPACAPLMCPPGTTPAAFPGADNCCAQTCKQCDPLVDATCTEAMGCQAQPCPAPPPVCADGSRPVFLPGACCATCPGMMSGP